jgi:DNA-binding NarL/FixJ family response regulator
MISIAVIEKEGAERENIESLVMSQKDLYLIGTGKDWYDAIKLTNTVKPDIIIIDSSLVFVDDVEISHMLKRNSPSTAVVILGSRENARFIRQILETGTASAYLLRDTDMDHLVAILRDVYNGKPYVNSFIAARVFWTVMEKRKPHTVPAELSRSRQPDFPARLSRREIGLLAFIAEGCPDKEIAERLKLKSGTVRNYISSAMRKAGCKNRTQIAVYALSNGLILRQPEGNDPID